LFRCNAGSKMYSKNLHNLLGLRVLGVS